jgi:uncharacterized membrane protein SirB2
MKTYLKSQARDHFLIIVPISLTLIVAPILISYFATDLGTKLWGRPTGEIICPPSQNYWCSAIASNEHFCEPIVWERFLRTEYNAVSNMAFPISGMITLSASSLHLRFMKMQLKRQLPSNHLQMYKPFTKMYAALYFMGGFGSFYCHSAVTFASAQWDRAGIWCLVCPALGMATLRYVPMRYGTPRFYALFTTFFCFVMPLGLSLFHILDPENPLATPLLYVGLPITFLVLVLLVIVRPFLASRIESLPRAKSNWYLAVFAICCIIVAFLCQDPTRVNACEADVAKPYLYTHMYWHILVAVASFANHRFCFTETWETSAEASDAGRGDFRGESRTKSIPPSAVSFDKLAGKSLLPESSHNELSVAEVEIAVL